ncbi:MAG: PfkB family carbohydrate kinase [Treponema sp.]|nr:PfkB family carbohydrate kinase [Treponema sp.]MCL2250420.1 PfkB family carbohydrate kinase [Treponema sp.]
MKSTEILCIGNPIVDVFINIDNSHAQKYGILVPVQHIDRELAEAMLRDKTIDFSKGEKSSGGGAANVAKIAAMLGMKSAFVGTIGQDEHASFFEEEITSAGVHAILEKSGRKTGLCFACNIGGETRFAASPGAALELTENHVSEEMIGSAELIVLDGYILDRRPLVQHILLKASRKGIPVALDVASVMQAKSKAEEILTYSRQFPLIVFMNADETLTFCSEIRRSGNDDDLKLSEKTDKEKEALILRDFSPMLKIITDGELFPIVVVKLGGRGAIVFAGGNMYKEETFTVVARNTIGAGDAFCAAFISAWIRDKSISECTSLGNKVAREILEVPGTHIKSGKLKAFAKIFQK